LNINCCLGQSCDYQHKIQVEAQTDEILKDYSGENSSKLELISKRGYLGFLLQKHIANWKQKACGGQELNPHIHQLHNKAAL
jgi:hypothetical protein